MSNKCKMNFKSPELFKLEGCKGCKKNCLFNTKIASRETILLNNSDLFLCNSQLERKNNESNN